MKVYMDIGIRRISVDPWLSVIRMFAKLFFRILTEHPSYNFFNRYIIYKDIIDSEIIQ